MAETLIAELKGASKAKREAAFEQLWAQAEAAGAAAAAKCKPKAMVVGTPKDAVASLLGGDGGGFDENEPTYYVADGVCGFAWVTITPGTSSFARWVKRERGGRAGYYGGLEVSVFQYRQSMELKQAHAAGMASVLRAAGVEAFAGSRMD